MQGSLYWTHQHRTTNIKNPPPRQLYHGNTHTLSAAKSQSELGIGSWTGAPRAAPGADVRVGMYSVEAESKTLRLLVRTYMYACMYVYVYMCVYIYMSL